MLSDGVRENNPGVPWWFMRTTKPVRLDPHFIARVLSAAGCACFAHFDQTNRNGTHELNPMSQIMEITAPAKNEAGFIVETISGQRFKVVVSELTD